MSSPYKIYITDIPGSRTGNKIFQWAFGALLARRTDRELVTTGLDWFPSTQTHSIENCNAPKNNPCCTRSYGDNYIDPIIVSHPGDVVINSFVQKAAYYVPNRPLLKQHLKLHTGEKLPERPDYSDLVVHIRRTDYVTIGNYPGIGVFEQGIHSLKGQYAELFIVTDDPTDSEIIELARAYKGQIRQSSPKEDFYFLMNADYLMISQSSFSWWAAFLGGPRRLIVPLSTKTSNAFWYASTTPHRDSVDLATGLISVCPQTTFITY